MTTLTTTIDPVAMTPQERLAALRGEVTTSIESMMRAAEIYAAMERAHDDVTRVPQHLRMILRRIAGKHLLPEVVVRLEGRLRQRVSLLPLAEQRHYSDPEAVVDLLPSVEAEATVQIKAQHLTPSQVMQVFGEGYLRDASEQAAWLLAQRTTPTRAKTRQGRTDQGLDIQLDKEAGVAIIDGARVSRAKLAAILRDLDS